MNRLLATAFCSSFALALVSCSSGMSTTPMVAGSARTSSITKMAAFTAEMPVAAGAFVDSIGVNIHLSETGTPYTSNFSTLVQQLDALGIHHVRDGMEVGRTDLCAEAKQLAATGIRFTYITEITSIPSDYTNWASCTGNAIEAFEGPNEYDINHPGSDSNWPNTLATYQTAFYRAVKGQPSTSALPVIGPSLTSGSAYSAVGDLSNDETFGNMHDYFDGRNPGTPGWGDGGYGSIGYNIATAKVASQSRSIEATETGYPISSDPVAPNITEFTSGKYLPRLFLEQWNAGVPRTWAYELYDEGSPPFDSYGLVTSSTLAPKWSYWALKNFISVISDSALSIPNAGPLYWTMSGATTNVHHLVMQKADGSCFLALWIEMPSNDPNSGTAIAVAPQAVTISMPQAPNTASVYAYDSRMNLNATTITPSTTINLSLTDTVTLLRMHW